MKICVIGGGGAIGGYLAVMLAQAGNEVTVVARGATLAAVKERGLALIMDDQPEPLVAQVKAVEKITKNPKLASKLPGSVGKIVVMVLGNVVIGKCLKWLFRGILKGAKLIPPLLNFF
jgi:nucleoside-diphosphate-sugar epimerase